MTRRAAVALANGSLLQFGHGGDAVDDLRAVMGSGGVWSSFNSATAVTPWMTDPDAVREQFVKTRFNSATAVTPWMTSCALGPSGEQTESLQFGHGGDAVDDHGRQPGRGSASRGFNSATAVTPWMTWPSGRLDWNDGPASIRPRR